MSGISEIIKTEAHQKKLERLFKFKELMLPYNPPDTDYCKNEKCDCINRIQSNFIINSHVPQIVDIDEF